jgi:hypothetical protein
VQTLQQEVDGGVAGLADHADNAAGLGTRTEELVERDSTA